MPCLSVLEQWGALETCTSRSRGEATSSPWCFLPILLVSWAAATCRLVHRDRADDAGARYRADPVVLTHRITTPRMVFPNPACRGGTAASKLHQQTPRSIAGALWFRLWSARRRESHDPEENVCRECHVREVPWARGETKQGFSQVSASPRGNRYIDQEIEGPKTAKDSGLFFES